MGMYLNGFWNEIVLKTSHHVNLYGWNISGTAGICRHTRSSPGIHLLRRCEAQSFTWHIIHVIMPVLAGRMVYLQKEFYHSDSVTRKTCFQDCWLCFFHWSFEMFTFSQISFCSLRSAFIRSEFHSSQELFIVAKSQKIALTCSSISIRGDLV